MMTGGNRYILSVLFSFTFVLGWHLSFAGFLNESLIEYLQKVINTIFPYLFAHIDESSKGSIITTSLFKAISSFTEGQYSPNLQLDSTTTVAIPSLQGYTIGLPFYLVMYAFLAAYKSELNFQPKVLLTHGLFIIVSALIAIHLLVIFKVSQLLTFDINLRSVSPNMLVFKPFMFQPWMTTLLKVLVDVSGAVATFVLPSLLLGVYFLPKKHNS